MEGNNERAGEQRSRTDETLTLNEIPDLFNRVFDELDRNRSGALEHDEIMRMGAKDPGSKEYKAGMVLEHSYGPIANLTLWDSGITKADMKIVAEIVGKAQDEDLTYAPHAAVMRGMLSTLNAQNATEKQNRLGDPLQFAKTAAARFNEMDKDKDGTISIEELKQTYNQPGIDSELEQLVYVMGNNHQKFASMDRRNSDGIRIEDLNTMIWAADKDARDADLNKRLAEQTYCARLNGLATAGFAASTLFFGTITALEPNPPTASFTATSLIGTGIFAALTKNNLDNRSALRTAWKSSQEVRSRMYEINEFRQHRGY